MAETPNIPGGGVKFPPVEEAAALLSALVEATSREAGGISIDFLKAAAQSLDEQLRTLNAEELKISQGPPRGSGIPRATWEKTIPAQMSVLAEQKKQAIDQNKNYLRTLLNTLQTYTKYGTAVSGAQQKTQQVRLTEEGLTERARIERQKAQDAGRQKLDEQLLEINAKKEQINQLVTAMDDFRSVAKDNPLSPDTQAAAVKVHAIGTAMGIKQESLAGLIGSATEIARQQHRFSSALEYLSEKDPTGNVIGKEKHQAVAGSVNLPDNLGKPVNDVIDLEIGKVEAGDLRKQARYSVEAELGGISERQREAAFRLGNVDKAVVETEAAIGKVGRTSRIASKVGSETARRVLLGSKGMGLGGKIAIGGSLGALALLLASKAFGGGDEEAPGGLDPQIQAMLMQQMGGGGGGDGRAESIGTGRDLLNLNRAAQFIKAVQDLSAAQQVPTFTQGTL